MAVQEPASGLVSNNGSILYNEQGIPIEFPFTPYPAQKQMISKMIQAFEHCQNAILESPTGSGKSLAILVASLAWINHKTENIVEAPANNDDSEAVNPLSDEADLSWMGSDADKFKLLISQGKFESAFDLYRTRKADRPKPPIKGSERISGRKWNPTSKQDIPKIYIASRTHRQLAQLINELKNKTGYSPKMSVLGSRKQYCINEEVNYLENIDEACKTKVEHKSCSVYKEVAALEGHPDIQPGGAMEIWDIEDLTQLGNDIGACPYFASRDITQNAEVVFCPYNYLIDPMIRKSMGIEVKNNIIIIDEAHNIESTARDTGTFETSTSVIGLMQSEIKEVLRFKHLIEANTVLASFLSIIRNWMERSDFAFGDGEKDNKLAQCFTGDAMIEELEKMTLSRKSFLDIYLPAFQKVLSHFEDQNTSEKNSEAVEVEEQNADGTITIKLVVKNKKTISGRSIRVLEKLFTVLEFIFDQENSRSSDYTLAVLKKKQTTGRQTDLDFCLWCMNSGVIFTGLAEEAHSIILTSGTLSPMETFESELEVKFPIQLITDHVIEKSQVWANVIGSGPSNYVMTGTYQQAKQPKYLEEVSLSICNVVLNIPYGVLCFFPSYAALNSLYNYINTSNSTVKNMITSKKKIFLEPQNKPTSEFNELLEEYYDCIKQAENNPSSDGINGALFFAVYRGKVSEGIDFNDNNCRGVICIGIPFPSYGDKLVQLKRQYNDKKKQSAPSAFLKSKILSGSDWYDIQGYRALNQALGRCIRHRKDWGAIILLENRFGDYRHSKRLSKWIAPLLQKRNGNFRVAMEELLQFVNKHNWKSTKGYTLGGGDQQGEGSVDGLRVKPGNGTANLDEAYQKLISAFKSASSNQEAESSATLPTFSDDVDDALNDDMDIEALEEPKSSMSSLAANAALNRSSDSAQQKTPQSKPTVENSQIQPNGNTANQKNKTVEKNTKSANDKTASTATQPSEMDVVDLTDSPELPPRPLPQNYSYFPPNQPQFNGPPQPFNNGNPMYGHLPPSPYPPNGPSPHQPPHNNGVNGPHPPPPFLNHNLNGPHFNNGMNRPPQQHGFPQQPPFARPPNMPMPPQPTNGQMSPLLAGSYGPPPGYNGPWHIIYKPVAGPDGKMLPPQPFIVYGPPPPDNRQPYLLPMPGPQNQGQGPIPPAQTQPPLGQMPPGQANNNPPAQKGKKGKKPAVVTNTASKIIPIQFTQPIVNHFVTPPVSSASKDKGKAAVKQKGKAAVPVNNVNAQVQPSTSQAPLNVPVNNATNSKTVVQQPVVSDSAQVNGASSSNTLPPERPVKTEAPEHYRMASSSSSEPKSTPFVVYHIKRKYLDFDSNGVPSLKKIVPPKILKPMSKPHVEVAKENPPQDTPVSHISSVMQSLNIKFPQESPIPPLQKEQLSDSRTAGPAAIRNFELRAKANPMYRNQNEQTADLESASEEYRLAMEYLLGKFDRATNKAAEAKDCYENGKRLPQSPATPATAAPSTSRIQSAPINITWPSAPLAPAPLAPAPLASAPPAPAASSSSRIKTVPKKVTPKKVPPPPAPAPAPPAAQSSVSQASKLATTALESLSKNLIEAITIMMTARRGRNKAKKAKSERDVKKLTLQFDAGKRRHAAHPQIVQMFAAKVAEAEAKAQEQLQKDSEELAQARYNARASLEAQIWASRDAFEKAIAAKIEALAKGEDHARIQNLDQAVNINMRMTKVLTDQYTNNYGQLPVRKDKGKQAAPKTSKQPVATASSSAAASSSSAAVSSSSAAASSSKAPSSSNKQKNASKTQQKVKSEPAIPKFKSELSLAGRNISFSSSSSAVKSEPGPSSATQGSSPDEPKPEPGAKRNHDDSVVEFVETASGLILPKRRKK